MKAKLFLLTSLAGLGLASLSLATPFNPAEVSSEANWYVHADLDRARGTEVGQAIMAEIEKEHGAQLRAVKRMFSLNPLADLQGVTLWGTGEEDKGVVLIRGKFDREHLADLLAANEHYDTSTHHAHTVHTWKDKDKTQHGAFYRSDLAIISEDEEFVTAALDVLDKRHPAFSGAPDTGAAFLMGLVNLGGIEMKGEEAQLFRKATELRMRAFEAGERLQVEFTLNAIGREEAQRFQKVLEGMVALAMLSHEELADYGMEARISLANDTEVTINLSGPVDLVLDMLDKLKKKAA